MGKGRAKSSDRVAVDTRPKLLSTILLAAVLVPVIPLVIAFALIPSFLLRLIATLAAKVFRPDLHGILLGKGASFALETAYDRPRFNILIHLHFEKEVPLEEGWRAFQDLLNLRDTNGNFPYRQLRQTLSQFMGFFFWRWDKDFDIKNHVRAYDYTDPELAVSDPCTVEEMERVSGALLDRPWPVGRSPWELLVFRCVSPLSEQQKVEKSPGNSGKVFTVAALRIHHGMADGFSIVSMLLKIIGREKVKIPGPSLPQMSMLQRLTLPLLVAFRMPVDLATSLLSARDRPHCWHCGGMEGKEGSYEVFYGGDIPVDTIKRIKTKYGVSYNEAIYAVSTGVVRRMMVTAGQEIPTAVSSCVPLPLPNHPGGLYNHMTLLFFKFTPILAHPVERMSKICEAFQFLRASPTVGLVNDLVFDSLASMPIWIVRGMRDKLLKTSVLMTNFPGPETLMALKNNNGGAYKVTRITAAMGKPAGSWAATSLMLSYAGVQRISMAVEKKVFEKYKIPEDFPQLVNDEVEALLSAIPYDRTGLYSCQV